MAITGKTILLYFKGWVYDSVITITPAMLDCVVMLPAARGALGTNLPPYQGVPLTLINNSALPVYVQSGGYHPSKFNGQWQGPAGTIAGSANYMAPALTTTTFTYDGVSNFTVS